MFPGLLKCVRICPFNSNAEWSRKCEAAERSLKLDEITPVQDSKGILYRNIYCALCHFWDINLVTSVTPWKLKVKCDDNSLMLDKFAAKSLDELSNVTSSCLKWVVPPTGMQTHYCSPNIVNSCDYSLFDVIPGFHDLVALCSWFQDMITGQDDSQSIRYFANPFCALCNNISITNFKAAQCSTGPEFTLKQLREPADYLISFNFTDKFTFRVDKVEEASVMRDLTSVLPEGTMNQTGISKAETTHGYIFLVFILQLKINLF